MASLLAHRRGAFLLNNYIRNYLITALFYIHYSTFCGSAKHFSILPSKLAVQIVRVFMYEKLAESQNI